MAGPAAFLGACVLVPIVVSDTILRIADSGAFRPLWSRRVIAEALRALQRVHPGIEPARLRRRFHMMNDAVDSALVEGRGSVERSITLPDPNDRHVVAAALAGDASVIVTNNLRDFPAETLRPLGLAAVSADGFLLAQLARAPVATALIISEQAAAMERPPADDAAVLTRLARSGVPRFAAAVRAVNTRLGR